MSTWPEKFMAAPDAKALRPLLYHAVREVFLIHGNGPYSTVDLMEKLWPRELNQTARGTAEHLRRQALFPILASMAHHGDQKTPRGELADVTEKLPPRKGKFGIIRPWSWGPIEKRCPHCQGLL